MTKQTEKQICPKCKQFVTSNSVQCQSNGKGCQKWFHAGTQRCAGIDGSVWGVSWMCPDCISKIFQLLEQPTEAETAIQFKEEINRSRKELLRVWTESTSREEADVALINLESTLASAINHGVFLKSEEVSTRWGLIPSIFFAGTAIMTIGYGNVAPSTDRGRIFCIIFSLIGIPFMILVIGEWGKLASGAVSSGFQKIKRRVLPSQKGGIKKLYKKPLCFAAFVAVAFGYMLIGSAILLLWEDWTFFEAFYFCFITMTTIGFGDLVPANTKYLVLNAFYVLVGMALFSAIFELLQKELSLGWRKVKSLTVRVQAIVNPLTIATLRLNEHLHSESGEASAVNSLLTELEAFREQLRVIMLEAGEKSEKVPLPVEVTKPLKKISTISSDSSLWHMEWDPSWEERWKIFRENQSVRTINSLTAKTGS